MGYRTLKLSHEEIQLIEQALKEAAEEGFNCATSLDNASKEYRIEQFTLGLSYEDLAKQIENSEKDV